MSAANAAAAAPPRPAVLLVSIHDFEALRAAGITWPANPDAMRHLYRTRHQKRFDGAFKKVGHAILIDVPAFITACRRARA